MSYEIATRSGSEDEMRDMILRCNVAGVLVYGDSVINHMTGSVGKGKGINGTKYDLDNFDYPAVPFKKDISILKKSVPPNQDHRKLRPSCSVSKL